VALLDLDPDQLLTTTRAVRTRLDFSRPVPDDLIRECVAIAQQAPSGSNQVSMRFVVVRDQATRKAIGDIYRDCFETYRTQPTYAGAIRREDPAEQAQQDRVAASANYLAERMGEAPVLVIACNAAGRADNVPSVVASSRLGNILPATWSFMLAARARGLGTCWTTLHLQKEREVAEVVGIPYEKVQQACLTPVAFTKGTDFKPAARREPDSVIHWDRW
jgi:nitroreductase